MAESARRKGGQKKSSFRICHNQIMGGPYKIGPYNRKNYTRGGTIDD